MINNGISYSLTERYNIPHGLACAVSLPYNIRNPLFKKLGINRKEILKDVDIELVANEAIENAKLKGYTRNDIIQSLK